jgi:hypothetical protein
VSLSDTRLIARALVQRWPIKPEYREAIVKQLLKVVVDPGSSPREKTAAAKALLSAEAQNQSDEHKVIDGQLTNGNFDMARIAADLGVELSLVVDGTVEKSGSADSTSLVQVRAEDNTRRS